MRTKRGQSHAIDFVLHIEPRLGVCKLQDGLLEMASKSQSLQEDIKDLVTRITVLEKKFVEGLAIRPELHMDKRSLSELSVAAIYLRALAALNRDPNISSRVLSEPEKALKNVKRMLDKLEPDFIEHFIGELQNALIQDPLFKDKLEATKKEVNLLEGHMSNIFSKFDRSFIDDIFPPHSNKTDFEARDAGVVFFALTDTGRRLIVTVVIILVAVAIDKIAADDGSLPGQK